MKNNVCLAALCLLLFTCLSAQRPAVPKLPIDLDSIFADEPDVLCLTVPDEQPCEDFYPPAYPGGEPGIMRFLAENVRYPSDARLNNIQGNVLVSFIVEKDGSIGHATILKDIGGGCGDEAARVVQLMTQWRPGTVKGLPVRVRYFQPLRFRLEDPEPPARQPLRKRRTLFGNE